MKDNTEFKRETICYKGRYLSVEYHFDNDTEAPWEHSDGHGPVSKWQDKNAKRPGQMILSTDSYSLRLGCRFYDFEEATKIAKRDGWGIAPDKAVGLTRKQIIRAAVMADFEYLRSWCNNEWHWMGIVVTDIETEQFASLWGIESFDTGGYHQSIIDELSEEVYLPSVRATIKGAA